MKLPILTTALTAAAATAEKTCVNTNVPVPITTRNGVFGKLPTPQSNFDAATFTLGALRQGANGTEEALTGYNTIQKTYHVSVQYCKPAGADSGSSPVVQILTHGIGFDKTYWDLPLNNYNYSYVDNAVSHGYHTLAYDRLGLGLSSRGDPKDEIQAFIEVAALAQLTEMARKGSIPGQQEQKPEKVVHVGHSFGSGLSYALTATFPELSDGIILTGFSLNTSFQGYFLAGGNFQQAHLSSMKHRESYAPGYLVSSDISANQVLFFAPPYFDPKMLEFAEKNKQPVAIGELLTMNSSPTQSAFTGPVLIITGDQDVPFCGGDCSNTGGVAKSIPEMAKQAFPKTKKFEAYVQPNTGHGLNMHYNATAAYDYIAGFLKGSL